MADSDNKKLIKSCNSSKCEQVNPQSIENFAFHKGMKDGLSARCKNCTKQYYLNNRTKFIECAKQNYFENKEVINRRKQKYYRETIDERKAYDRQYNIKNKDSIKEYNKKYHSKVEVKNNRIKNNLKKYNLTIEQYNEILESQNYVCWICKNPCLSKRFKHLSVDHCHKTGKIRGLLCGLCNRALGFLKDDINLFKKCIEYLEKNNG